MKVCQAGMLNKMVHLGMEKDGCPVPLCMYTQDHRARIWHVVSDDATVHCRRCEPIDRDTRNACIMLRARVNFLAANPSEADCILLNAALHLERRMPQYRVRARAW